MGDPRRQRRKFSKPTHPWHKERIGEEKELVKKYALKNKKEIWKMTSIVKGFADQARKLVTSTTKQAEKEKIQLLTKLARLGLVKQTAKIEDVLEIKIEDILRKRLQTKVFEKGFARSAKQARQFIVHGHVTIGDKKITSPSYIVSVDEEPKIGFISSSGLSSPEHPERTIEEKPKKKK